MRRHVAIPTIPTGYPLHCRGRWSLVTPVAATNLITNPSMVLSTAGYAAINASMSADNSAARRGVFGLLLALSANSGGVEYAITLAPDETYTWSLDMKGGAGVKYQMRVYSTAAGAYLSNEHEWRGAGIWERHALSFPTDGTSGFILRLTQDGGSITPDILTDGWQCVHLPYDTTYIDGDQPGCRWVGVGHASVSVRDGQSRRGGRVVPLEAYGIQVLAEIGLGLGPQEDIVTPLGVLGGAAYQRTVARSRSFSLACVLSADGLPQLQRLQADLHGAVTTFGLAEQQPLSLRYQATRDDGTPIGDELELLCFYTGGLEGVTDSPYQERFGLQFTQYTPEIRSVGEAAVELGTTESITDANYIVERQATGVWHALGGGLGAGGGPIRVTCAVYGPDGNLYVGGMFDEAYNAPAGGSPVTVNNIAMWDGSAWAALGGGLDNEVETLLFDAAGNLYVGGFFANAGYPKIAMWDGLSWNPVGSPADATGGVHALAFDWFGNLYVGGVFSNWDGQADADKIVMWDGAAWHALGTGADNFVFELVLNPYNGWIVAGGSFTTIGGVAANRVASWSGTAWFAHGSGMNGTVDTLRFDSAGLLVAGGGFTDADYPYIARINATILSTEWELVGAGVNQGVQSLEHSTSGDGLIVSGLFTEAGGLTFGDRVARWTGSTWLPFPLDLPGTPQVTAIASHRDGRLVFGYDTTGTATSSTADTDVVNPGTAPAAPVFLATGPGRLESIVNWTSGKAIYFDLTLQTGETVFVDLTRENLSVISTMRGNLGGFVLPGSDLLSWRLVPGTNTIVVKSEASVYMRWRPTYLSLAGT